MVRGVQIAASRGQQFHRLADARWLVDAALFTDRQVHRQVQEGVVAGAAARFAKAGERRVHVGKLGVVFGVFGDPLAGQGLDGFHGLFAQALGMDRTEKSPHIGL
ncbi:hypothetical protein D9M69_701230 [compost metagenome]